MLEVLIILIMMVLILAFPFAILYDLKQEQAEQESRMWREKHKARKITKEWTTEIKYSPQRSRKDAGITRKPR